MGPGDWRRDQTPQCRQIIVDRIVEYLQKTLEYSASSTYRELAVKLEEKIFSMSKDKDEYRRRIEGKLKSLATNHWTKMIKLSSSNSLCSSETPSSPDKESLTPKVLTRKLNVSSLVRSGAASLTSRSPIHKQNQSPATSLSRLAKEPRSLTQLFPPKSQNAVASAVLGSACSPYARAPASDSTQARTQIANEQKCSVKYISVSSQNPAGNSFAGATPSGNPGKTWRNANEQQSSMQISAEQSQESPFAQEKLPNMAEQSLNAQNPAAAGISRSQPIEPQYNACQQQKLPCRQSESESLLSCCPKPDQILICQSQSMRSQQMVRPSLQDKQETVQASGNVTSGDELRATVHEKEQNLSKYFIEVKELCQSTSSLLRQQGSVPQDAKSRLDSIMKHIDDSEGKLSMDQLDLLKRRIHCVHQLAMPRKPASLVPYGQESSNLHAVQQYRQPQPQPAQLQPLEGKRKMQLQPVAKSPAMMLQPRNGGTTQQNCLCSSKPVPSEQNMLNLQQCPNKSVPEKGNTARLVQHCSAGNSVKLRQHSSVESKVPLSSPRQLTANNMPSQGQGNQKELNFNLSQMSSVALQRMGPEQKKDQHHVPAQVLKQQHHQMPRCHQQQKELPRQQQLCSQNMSKQQMNVFDDIEARPRAGNEISPHHINGVKISEAGQATSKLGVQQKSGCMNLLSTDQNLKSLRPLPISSPRNLQSAPKIPQQGSQIEQQTMLISCRKIGSHSEAVNSPYVIPESTPLPPSTEPGHLEYRASDASLLVSAGSSDHKHITEAQALATEFSTPGTVTTPIVSESKDPDDILKNALNITLGESSGDEQPVQRLIKAVKVMSTKAFGASVSEIKSVVGLVDNMATAAPLYGAKGYVGWDLLALSEHCRQARYSSECSNTFESSKFKRYIDAIPTDISSSTEMEGADLMSTEVPGVKRPRIEVKQTLLEEIRETNQQLIDTVVDISEELSYADVDGTEGNGGTFVNCSFSAVTVNPNIVVFPQISLIRPLRLLVPTNYPECSPIILDEWPGNIRKDQEDLSAKAKSRLSLSLTCLLHPLSVGEIARTWDVCVRAVIDEYARKNGGGNIFSKYGTWETCHSSTAACDYLDLSKLKSAHNSIKGSGSCRRI